MLGASDADVFRIVLGETLLICVAAGLLGAVAAILGSGLVAAAVRGMLPFAPTGDLVRITPVTLLQVGAGVVAVGLVAGLLPAWKASRMDPIRAIRSGE